MASFALVCRAADPTQTHLIARQAEALAVAGHTVDIIAPTWPALVTVITQPRVRVRSLGNAPGAGPSLAAFFFWLRASLSITLAQLQRRYHAIQMTGSTGIFIFTAWLAHLLGGRIVLDMVVAGPERLMERTGAPRSNVRIRAAVLMEQLVVDFADHLITVSEPLRVRLISRGCPSEKINVIYRTPDEELYGHPISVTRHPSIANRFLVVCRAHAAEAFDFATPIRAVASLRERLPNVLLWVLCPPARRAELETLIRSLDATQYVLLQAELAPDAIPAFISQADANIICVPRTPESDLILPDGLLESLGLGVPAITVRTQATQYYFDPRSLFVFDSEDAGDLAARIEWLAHHPSARGQMMQHSRELAVQLNWSRERHRYVALMVAVAVQDVVEDRAPAEAAGFSKASRPPRPSIRAYTAAAALASPIVTVDNAITDGRPIDQIPTVQNLPLRLSAPSTEWRAGRRLRMRLGAWTLRGTATVLLFGLPVVASHPDLIAKGLAALMLGALIFLLLLLPSGEAAIIVALYFIAQRALLLHFVPEGRLGGLVIEYLGSALQLIIFIGFSVRTIVQQRPLQRSGFILWPASLYLVVSLLSALVNHVPLSVAGLGIEHTLHNLVFVVLIAEDLPSPQQLRGYIGFVIAGLSALALYAIVQTGVVFHWLGVMLAPGKWTWLLPAHTPVAVIVPDADTFAYLLNFGILLALAIFITVNQNAARFNPAQRAPGVLNAALLGAVVVLTFAEFLTRSTENWVGLVMGTIAILILMREQLRFILVGYLVLLLALAFVAVPTIPKGAPASVVGNLVGVVQGHPLHGADVGAAWQVIRDHPLLGVGPGRFGGTVAYITNSPINQQYNIQFPAEVTSIDLFWLHIWGETGILGLGVFLWLMFQSGQTIARAYRKGAHRQWHGITAGVFGIMFALCIATIFGNALEVDSISAPFWALVGIAIALPLANRPLITESLPIVRFSAAENAEHDADLGSNGASRLITKSTSRGTPS
jgi:glycosyltransferase involved in cell wall biosynthesis